MVSSELLCVPTVQGSATGENIFSVIDAVFSSHGIPWENCISSGCDNANVMVGKKKGVYGFLLQKNPAVHLSGCTLHLVHIAAEKAANVLPAAIEEILIDIYYYFKKSSKRQDSLGMFQDMYDIDQKKMIKHVATRWLSIDRCLKRLLDNWVALKEYFTNENDQFKKQSKSKGKSSVNMLHKKLEKIADFLRSPTNKLYTMFLLCAHATFATFLTVMQAEKPKIHVLQSNIRSLERTILSKFINHPPSPMDHHKWTTDHH
jgi:hypothetical protein